ncbi:hypothetical protein NHX12_023854 [Muraenolepis orangiensis]|uniref:Uncharacterized protein n=1 Tax=Muraenolepis orangiensis TaxID=630683 RepID=A0A9Q0ENX9_9TELE|nr:hypothetical protein NHX12_023854 [Muraenolepis orangiensis]
MWGWVRPTFSYRPWGRSAESENTTIDYVTTEKRRFWGLSTLNPWAWNSYPSGQTSVAEEFFEAPEKLQSREMEELGAGKQDLVKAEHAIWWNKIIPSSVWPTKTESSGLGRRKGEEAWDNDADVSDYGTPPPSPTPPSSTRVWSAIGLFVNSWKEEILPEHYEISFNFLRHLFDLVVVGFLWTVSPPTKLILEVLGVQGALRLWLHGMAMFFVSTVGMAGLLWLIQEYLPQFALIYGIAQALVISVSVKQGVILGGELEENVQEMVKEDLSDEDQKPEENNGSSMDP